MGQCVCTKRFFDRMLEFTLGKKPPSMLQGRPIESVGLTAGNLRLLLRDVGNPPVSARSPVTICYPISVIGSQASRC
jgi:hypothetical protein